MKQKTRTAKRPAGELPALPATAKRIATKKRPTVGQRIIEGLGQAIAWQGRQSERILSWALSRRASVINPSVAAALIRFSKPESFL
jgi:hypothetical protein